MTRINVIPVKELTDQHLLAEAREIIRLPKNLKQSLERKSKSFSMDEIPPEYVLGKGHVKHFFDKFQWLESRFTELVKECENRGFNLSYKDSSIFRNVPSTFYGRWEADEKALELNLQRIEERINAKPGFYRIRGEYV